MQLILGTRGSGKTTDLIQQCAKHDYALIVCHSHEEARRIATRAREMGLDIPFPLSYDEFKRGAYYGKVVDAFYIDNADMFLQSLTSVPILSVTITKEV